VIDAIHEESSNEVSGYSSCDPAGLKDELMADAEAKSFVQGGALRMLGQLLEQQEKTQVIIDLQNCG
jgi:hypothetical protein